jgi:hypothetical protein
VLTSANGGLSKRRVSCRAGMRVRRNDLSGKVYPRVYLSLNLDTQ